MRPRSLALGLLAASVPLTIGGFALARRMVNNFDMGPTAFEMLGRPIGGAKPAGATAAHLTGSRIMATDDGAVVIDADSGALVRTDRNGKNLAQLAIGREAGLLTYDAQARIAYVADRLGDRIVAVKLDKLDNKLEIAASWKTPAEPYGIALSPDRKTLFVSTIADRTFVAYDVSGTTGKEKWRAALAREPRGIAVSPDGTRAMVAYIATGTVDQIDLVETHRPEHIALSTTAASSRGRFRGGSSDNGDSFARAAFAVTFMGDRQAVTAFQRETPVQIANGSERTGSYGGGFEPPVVHQLAFLGVGGASTPQTIAAIAQHQPRALAWDGVHDALYVAGFGSDSVLQIRNASQVNVAEGLTTVVTSGKSKCGPDGLAIMADGNVLVWCSFTRNVERLDVVDAKGTLATATKLSPGPSLVASAYTDKQHDGMVLFSSADAAVSQRGALACSTCHPDQRADGLSWRIDKHELQTPLLNGRVTGTHPYKWDGGDPTLRDSLASTMKRLGGFGLQKEQTDALASYLEAIPTVRVPTRDATSVARGKKMFDEQLGCKSCHDGAMYTDQERHKLTGTLEQSDTPSLKGLAASAPYYHDGSAATLEALIRDRAAVHGMTEPSKLNDQQVADLTAFLETL
ncbi:MAG: c-type cytochrome [Proteobacteria bacterium]|nr:c-type cytochrome [Pseudomonadota bacterium]